MRTSVLILVVALAAAGCSSGLNRPVKEVTASMGTDHVQHVRIVTHSYWFEPNRVVVHAGTPVELEIHNGALFVPHNFTCAELDLNANLGMFLGTKKLRFTPEKPGEYPFFCHVGSHMKKGMQGTLVVVS